MKLYKYRSLLDADGLERLVQLLRSRAFWCARPDALNDPEEFAWTCDYTPSCHTAPLLAELLVQSKGRTPGEARSRVVNVINAGRLREVAEPVVASMIHQCRNEIGLACFANAADNDTLWERYAGGGAGVCIEVDVPDRLLGTQLYAVQYWDKKVIHIDTLLRSRLERSSAAELYALSLLAKPSFWAPEAEIRFVSKKQNVSVVIDGSAISSVVLGDSLEPQMREVLAAAAPTIPMVSRGFQPTA